jgi:hypothetical protein
MSCVVPGYSSDQADDLIENELGNGIEELQNEVLIVSKLINAEAIEKNSAPGLSARPSSD